MEIPGDVFKPLLGMVTQRPGFVVGGLPRPEYFPVGRLVPWKMTRATLDPTSDKVDTPNNAVPRFHQSIGSKRIATGKIENACYDPDFNFYSGANPFTTGLYTGAAAIAGTAISLIDGYCFRMACIPFSSAFDVLGGLVGLPIRGAAGELLPPVATPSGGLLGIAYTFLTCRVTKIHHMADAAAGQPFDFDFETTMPYATPGDAFTELLAYGFSATIGVGGFF